MERAISAAASRPRSETAALYALALGTFAVGTEGFMIAAILPTISKSLSTSIQAAGQLVTIFALVYAVSSPVLTALTAGYRRRSLLIGSLAAFVVANLVAAVAPGYWALAGARVLLALAAGLYVPNANALAGSLVAPERRGRALAIVNGGITVAIAIGVPLGAFVGTHLGWRMTFVGVAVLAGFALAFLSFQLSSDIEGARPATLRERFALIGNPGVLATLATTTIWAVAAYTVYTYVAPFLAASAGLTSSQTGLMLMLLGASAVVGVTAGGIANDRFGARLVQAVTLPLMALAFAGLTVASLLLAPRAVLAMVPLVVLWGLSAWGFFPSQQDRLIRVTGVEHASVALSLNASFMYVGFSLGAVLGSLVISFTSIAWIGAAAAVCVVLAIAVSRLAWVSAERGMPIHAL
ncbi:MFS transporter [Sphingomonas faeni]|uniref:MFS transporter n=1 Tax=Sphingomonas faeni TaxID=185950 RepID=UPI0033488982